jgi:acetyl-CoA carboxylase biotin carboxyl carrier protein
LLDINNIKKLIEMMVAHDLVEISLRDGEEEVNLRRPNSRADFATMASPPGSVMPSVASNPAPAGAPAGQEAKAEADETELLEIVSPMVGTFYTAPDPDSAPYVTPGAQVHAGMVVCILEAMKVFNEIKSEVAGSIERALVENGKPVEYGQPLFLVRPH